MYDINKDGFITSSEMLRIFKAIDKLTSVGKFSQVQESPEMVLVISSCSTERRTHIPILAC